MKQFTQLILCFILSGYIFEPTAGAAESLVHPIDRLFSHMRTLEQFEVVANAFFPAADDKKFIKEVIAAADPKTSIRYSRKGTVVSIKAGPGRLKIDTAKAVIGEYLVNGKKLKLEAQSLRELTSAIQKVAESKKAWNGPSPFLFFHAEEAQALGLEGVLVAYGVGATVMAAICKSNEFGGEAFEYKKRTKDKKTKAIKECVKQFIKGPFILLAALMKNPSRPLPAMDAYFTSAKIQCPEGPDGQLTIERTRGNGATDVVNVALKAKQPIHVKFTTKDKKKAKDTEKDKKKQNEKEKEKSLTAFVNADWKITETRPQRDSSYFPELSEEFPIYKDILNECKTNSGGIEKLQEIFNLEDTVVDRPSPKTQMAK